MTPHQLYVLVGVYLNPPADDGTNYAATQSNYAATQSLMEDGLVRLNTPDNYDTFVVTQKGQAHSHRKRG